MTDIAERSITTIRTLAMDGVQQANSGHPGTAMALAPIAYLYYREYLRHDPTDPHWPGRDRFVLSPGHACILQYAALHLAGYGVSLDDLKAFRQWGSLTPGHPEAGHTPGIETTTGPLGQGIGNAVGFALAERMLAERYNRPGHEVIDHNVFGICSDGDLMEGVAHEAASLAGHLGLGKLTFVYDDNRITIEGDTGLAFSEDVAARFQSLGWHVQRLDDGWSLDDVRRALDQAAAETAKPSLIVLRTHIAPGAPTKQDTAEAHGAPLGEEEIRQTKAVYGWPEDAQFLVPDEVAAHMDGTARGRELKAAWQERMDAYRAAHPDLAAELERVLAGELPDGWDADLPAFDAAEKGVASRVASGKAINALAARIPELVGGSADLAPSNNTHIADGLSVSARDFGGRNLHFGIREHGMGAILNGMALHGGFRVFGATFLVFSDYMRGAVRLSALSHIPVTYVWTHDSVYVGEDGPTHQPVEHLMALRVIPNLVVLRPCDANETVEAWRYAQTHRSGPVAIVLTRQNLPTLDRAALAPAADLARGAYVLADADGGQPDAIVIATGSEVAGALAARELLAAEGVGVRVVSMPSWELFEAQDAAYRESVLPAAVTRRVSYEAGVTQGWERWVGLGGACVGIDRFGASAPGGTVAKELGMTPEAVAEAVRRLG
ncbi:MAG: transketolase [Gaiellales bacterium]